MNFLFGWLLSFPPWVGILLLCFIISLLVTLIYKFTTNQSLMKTLKEEIKALQAEMKTLKHDPAKMMEVNKRAMETNMKYMSQSFRPMIFTFLPVIIIFGWLNAHLAFEPIQPGHEFSMDVALASNAQGVIRVMVPDGMTLTSDENKTVTDGHAIFTMKADEPGLYSVMFSMNGKTYTKDVKVTSERAYLTPALSVKDDNIATITTVHQKTSVLFGLSWFWAYLIFSLIFSMGLRKIMKVY